MNRALLPLLMLAALLAVAATGLARPQTPATMQAVRVHAFGGPEVLQLDDVPVPHPAPGEALIRVKAAGVNPVDWKIRSGMIRKWAGTLPYTPGFDVAGVVEQVGDGVDSLKPGDDVYCFIAVQRGGGYAQFVSVPAEWVALKPGALSFQEAASVPLAALTAWQALFDKADLQPGQTVLIHGAAGGVGHFAVQLAHAKGARVIATASPRNHEFLKSIGADVVIDYRTQVFENFAKDVDVVLDSIGADTQRRSMKVIRPGGFLVSIVQPPDADELAKHDIRGAAMLVEPNAEELAEIATLIDEGKVRPEVSATYPLADVATAHREIQKGHTRGKIVLEMP